MLKMVFIYVFWNSLKGRLKKVWEINVNFGWYNLWLCCFNFVNCVDIIDMIFFNF